jgi:hypothetical protein
MLKLEKGKRHEINGNNEVEIETKLHKKRVK